MHASCMMTVFISTWMDTVTALFFLSLLYSSEFFLIQKKSCCCWCESRRLHDSSHIHASNRSSRNRDAEPRRLRAQSYCSSLTHDITCLCMVSLGSALLLLQVRGYDWAVIIVERAGRRVVPWCAQRTDRSQSPCCIHPVRWASKQVDSYCTVDSPGIVPKTRRGARSGPPSRL